jgi:hypothetical protein
MGTVNWADLQKAAGEAGFDPVPAAVYDVAVEKAEAKQSNSGKDMIAVTFKITAGPYTGKPVFTQFVLSPDNPTALNFFFRHLAALGITKEFFTTNPRMDQIAVALVNRPGRVKVSIKEYNGLDRNQVDQVFPPPPGTTPAPLPTGPVALGPGGMEVFAPTAPAPPMPSGPIAVAPSGPIAVAPPGPITVTPAVPVTTPPMPPTDAVPGTDDASAPPELPF